MQEQMGYIDTEVKKTKEQLATTAKERDQALDQLRKMKKMAQEANLKLCESPETNSEINSAKQSLSEVNGKIYAKENEIESLKVELRGKDANLGKLNEQLNYAKSCEAEAKNILSQTRTRIQELEAELVKGKTSELMMHDSLVAQFDQLEKTKMQLVESKLEIATLQEKVEKLETKHKPSETNSNVSQNGPVDNLELSSLKKELKLAIEAEEHSKRAMDDLALVLKEVTTEANQMKEKLILTESELEHAKEEANSCKEQLHEANTEIVRHKNTIKRLRLEAEESLLAWNGRETGFVDCIKRAEEEKTLLHEENTRMEETLKEAELKLRQSMFDNVKLRDILKQALNEATMAKEAASIAKDENSQLKDSIKERDKQISNLSQEIECLKDNEALAFENIKELKRMIFEASPKQVDAEDEAKGRNLNKHNTISKSNEKGSMRLAKAFSFNLKDLMHNKQKDTNEDKDSNEEPENVDPLKGSIFDTDSPVAAPPSRKSSTMSLDSAEMMSSDEFDGNRRRRMLRRFGNLLMGRTSHKKEPSISPDETRGKPIF